MRRYAVLPLTGTGTEADPYRPNTTATSWLMLAVRGAHCLVKMVVPDGTPATATTLADLQDGGADVDAVALTSGQLTTLKTFLANQGIDTSTFDGDGVNDRRLLLRWLLRRWLGWALADVQAGLHLHGFEVR